MKYILILCSYVRDEFIGALVVIVNSSYFFCLNFRILAASLLSIFTSFICTTSLVINYFTLVVEFLDCQRIKSKNKGKMNFQKHNKQVRITNTVYFLSIERHL